MLVFADVQAQIWGSNEVYVRKGSTISLTCSVNSHGVPPSNVTWYHAGMIIDFDGPRYVSKYSQHILYGMYAKFQINFIFY